MTFIEHLRLLQRIDGFIHRKCTGTADELGNTLDISRRSVFRHFEDLRALGAEVEFHAERGSFNYVNNQRPQLPTLVL